MKNNPKNWFTQSNEEQEQGRPPDEANFLGDAVAELRIKPQEQQQQQKPAEEDDEEAKRKKAEEEAKKGKETQVDPNKPNFKRTEKKPEEQQQQQKKPDKEESMQTLRTQRDDYQKKLDERTAYEETLKTTLGVQDLVVLAPLTAYVSERLEGVVTEEKVKTLLEGIKSGDQKIQEYDTKLKETTGKLREVNIEFDPEFQRDFVQPWVQAQDTLFLDFATVVKDGDNRKIIGKGAAEAFYKALTADPSKINATEAKALLLQYQQDYKKETGGEEPVLPTVTQLMGSLREFSNKREAMVKAHQNWEQDKTSSQAKSALEQKEAQKALTEKQQRDRGRLAQKAFNEFDFKSYEGIVDESELESFFDEEFATGEKIINPTKKEDVPEWDKLLTRGVYAKLAPILLEKLKVIMADNEILKKKVDAGETRGSGGGGGFRPSTDKVDFLGDAKSLLGKS